MLSASVVAAPRALGQRQEVVALIAREGSMLVGEALEAEVIAGGLVESGEVAEAPAG